MRQRGGGGGGGMGGGLPPAHPSLSASSAPPNTDSVGSLGLPPRRTPATIGQGPPVVDVWASNLKEAMADIMELVEDYPMVAMDTEFPGIITRPVGTFSSAHAFHYSTLKSNVDLLKLIQLGITFFDAEGRLRGSDADRAHRKDEGKTPLTHTWQFHFMFDLEGDISAPDSMEVLQAAGLDFPRHAREGIDLHVFGEALTVSGLVLNEHVSWITFHGGYDFGYLLKLLSCLPLPSSAASFFETLRFYFPNIYDVKHMAWVLGRRGGLQRLTTDLKVVRVGRKHQAGSDAYVTGQCFFAIRPLLESEAQTSADAHTGTLYGLRSVHGTSTVSGSAGSASPGSNALSRTASGSQTLSKHGRDRSSNHSWR